jgi:hypothetical protein
LGLIFRGIKQTFKQKVIHSKQTGIIIFLARFFLRPGETKRMLGLRADLEVKKTLIRMMATQTLS